MNILGIESSCDETSAAVVKNGQEVLSLIIASQADMHSLTGGVVPEVAAREHVKAIVPTVKAAIKEANVNWDEIDGIAVTRGPGLIGSLLTGLNAARTLSWIKEKPIIGVNHIEGHIYANWMSKRANDTSEKKRRFTNRQFENIEFPAMILTISGGHNELILMKDHGVYELIGESQDDAAGEAFDKVARILGLGFPGGPAISREAEKGNPHAIEFPRAWLQNTQKGQRPREITNFDFSFSGLKTAVLREVQKYHDVETRFIASKNDNIKNPTIPIADIAASFQEAVVDVLATKLIAAAKKYKVKEVHLAGGVSANKMLRERVVETLHATSLQRGSITFRHPQEIIFCTDNAAMIAAAGFYATQKGWKDDWKSLETEPGLRLVRGEA